MANYIFLPVNTDEMREMAKNISGYMAENRTPINQILANPYESGWKKGAMRMFGRKFGQGCLRDVLLHDTLYIVAHGSGLPGSGTIGAGRIPLGALTAQKVYTKQELEALKVQKVYTQQELAVVLKAEGLTTSFRNIHLMTCGSGLMNKNIVEFAAQEAVAARAAEPARNAVPGRIGVPSKPAFAAREAVAGKAAVPARDAVPDKAAKVLGTKQMRDPKLNPLLINKKSVAQQLCIAMRTLGYTSVQVTGYLGDIVVHPPKRVTILDYFSGQEMDLSWKVVVT